MFDNIGGKIKGLAKFFCAVGIIICVITGIVLMATNEALILAGILTIVVGSLLSWVSSFVLYGFGQLVENSDVIAEPIKKQMKKREVTMAQKKKEVARESVRNIDYSDNSYIDITCPHCGKGLSFQKWMITSNDTLTCPECDRSFSTRDYL